MLAWWMGVAPAVAQTVTFELDPEVAAQIGIDPTEIEKQFGDAIHEQLNLTDPESYLSSFANADAMALKGMGVDYASNPKKFSIGGTLGSAVSDVPLSFVRERDRLPEGGFAAMASLYAGVNLGALSPGEGALDRVMLYVNGLAFRPPGARGFRGSMYNFGAHLQVKALGPFDLKVAEWGGIDLTAGYERSLYRLELSRELPVSQALTQGGESATVTWTATGNYAISASSGTVPLEVSTNVRLLVLTAYAGAAVDVNLASASSQASLAGPVSARYKGDDYRLGTAGVTLEDQARADPFVPRTFVGAQVNVFALKVYGQLNLGANQTYGGFLGARVAM